MLTEISLIEEALREALGIRFGKLIVRECNVTTSVKNPLGLMVRKTTITEIVRDGHVIKRHTKKGLLNVI